MTAYLVTGRSGTGKTAIWKELLSRGYPAFDGDKVPGMAGWAHRTTKEHIGKQYPGDGAVMSYAWVWDKEVLLDLLSKHNNVFLCGNADNVTDYYSLFDRVFILSLAEDEHRKRINTRTEHSYGKDPHVQDEVISGQKEMVTDALKKGAIAIDATPPVGNVVDAILRHSLS